MRQSQQQIPSACAAGALPAGRAATRQPARPGRQLAAAHDRRALRADRRGAAAALLLGVVLLAGCRQQQPDPATPPPDPEAAATAAG